LARFFFLVFTLNPVNKHTTSSHKAFTENNLLDNLVMNINKRLVQGVQSSRKPASSAERKSVDNKHTLFNSKLHFRVIVDRLPTAVNED
jgi:hypothetical protein